jgi:mannitol/fructose-specific phosphotransferase system IIA component (Ntr-type)
VPTSAISQLVELGLIEPFLKARNKEAALVEIVGLAGRTGLVRDTRELLDSLRAREKVSSTALPEGFALLHPKDYVFGRFRSSFMVLGRLAEPIPFGRDDGAAVDILFLSCCQTSADELAVMGQLFRMIRNADLLSALRESASSAAMHQCLVRCEQRMVTGSGAGEK